MALILLCEEDIDPTGSDVRCVRKDRICDIILPLYPSWCQITHLTKTETEPQISNPSLGFTLAEPQTGIIVKSWFGVLSQSFPSSGWRKQSFWEGKRQKIELKLFLLGHDQYKRYILQKTGSKTAICVLRTGLNNLHPLMWGSHGQLDDRPTKTQMTIGDHLVGWATTVIPAIFHLFTLTHSEAWEFYMQKSVNSRQDTVIFSSKQSVAHYWNILLLRRRMYVPQVTNITTNDSMYRVIQKEC